MKIGNLEVYGVIYKITNKVNNKVYIGQTKQKRGFKGRYGAKGEGIERIYNYYKTNMKCKDTIKNINQHLMKSIEKYGFENFEVIEIYDVAFSKKELDIKEKIYIRLYNCISNGYNTLEGGNETPVKQGGNHYKAKYSNEQIIETKRLMCETKLTSSEISKITGVDVNSISVIRSVQSWSSVGEEYNEELIRQKELRKYRSEFNCREHEDIIKEYYNKGYTQLETCKALNLVDEDYVITNRRCALPKYEEMVTMYRIFKHRELGKTKICQECGMEYILSLTKRSTHNRKYCNKCAKEVDRKKSKERQRKKRNKINKTSVEK